MQDVRSRLPDAQLVVARRGPLRKPLEAQAAAAGVPARFLGTLTPQEVKAWMNRARVLAVPSVTAADGDAEGLPIVALEAMAMGTPVVGSASAGIPEAITTARTGCWGPRAIDGWRRMSEAPLSQVRERFDLRRQKAELENLYHRAIGGEA